ncbi:MAG: hypothetical protein MMC23_000519 [Stictis urceolatum]|nr:hypothetical protein [Stictis urceolata]
MSATEISPSQSIEASLLNRHASVSSHASFTDPEANTYIPQVPHNGMSDMSHLDAMDHQPSPPHSGAEPAQQESVNADVQDHDRMAMDVDPVPQETAVAATEPSPPPQQDNQPTADEPSNNTASTSRPPSAEPQGLVTVLATPNPPAVETPPTFGESERQSGGAGREDSIGTRTEEEDNEEEGEEDNDESSDDEDEYWGGHRDFVARLKEDTSTPTEAELKELEKSTERSALDHGKFESSVCTTLDDPEYVPVEFGRITWTLSGFHGTKEAPNKQRVMRSPFVNIGGYQWSIKVYPHGNDGTDYVSVYVECAGPESSGEPAVVGSDDANTQGVPAEESAATSSEAKETHDTDTTETSNASIDGSWEVPAQVGCVMYNPDEPRVYAFDRSNYQFHNKSPDCGWVRYYGPWHSLHVRRHLQRQPMLRNDQLAFTAYIRVISDPTKALWFRYGEDGIWDSVLKTGLRGFSAGDSSGASVIAALTPWFHLQPFRKLILDANAPRMATEPRKPVKPLIQASKDALYRKYAPENHSPGYPESLSVIRRTLQLYGLFVRQSTDTMEVWETLRNALNAEYWNETPQGNNPDVLSFIKTVRQNARPLLPGETQDPVKEPRSVQEIVSHASEDSQNSYKDWDGYRPSSQNIPSVLQIELCRQRYDPSARKWKRLTHHIKMNDKITVGKNQYSLFAIVISKGELGSGRVYPIVRAAGPNSQWARYKSHNVTYLTRKQAVESHEGRGQSREGTESVAHLVLYVRCDVLDSVLPPPEYMPTSKVMFPLERPTPTKSEDSLKIVVHDASSFNNYSGLLTFMDPWATEDSKSFDLSLDPAATLLDVQEKLLNLYENVDRADQIRLWSIATQSSPVPQPRDLYLVDTPPSTPISELTLFFGGIRLWASIIPMDQINPKGSFKVLRTEVPWEPPTAITPIDPQVASTTPPSASTTTEVPPEPPMEPFPEVDVPPSEPPMEPFPVVDIPPPEPPEETSLEPQSQNLAEDIVMGGTQDQPMPNVDAETPTQGGGETQVRETPIFDHQMHARSPSQSDPIRRAFKEEKIPDWQLRDFTYLLFKAFDPQSQQALGVGSGFYPRDKRLTDIVSELGISYKEMKMSRECCQGATPYFYPEDTVGSAALSNGHIVVVVRDDISENDKEVIRARGDFLDFPAWYNGLYSMCHFSRQAPLQSGFYFGGKYAHAPLYKGKFLGDSIIINSTGDAYKGNCLSGEYHGQGIMYYANGNTYTGEWVNGLPEGQGTMVYNQTGNKYVGGWRAGRKHGKGVMTYEVADEEMQLCKICYENEMDALFFRCGHVAACENCARQVSDCPVCRKPVEHVVKIFRTV